ncbi:NAD-dependent deacylase [uncultured Xanthomonas sp.]|uniref:SIR2 family NAD-dependent protein deacylase n=1 Tax=uncultured Xanthomonas sp. TaxID=152831 RepID=UPI0025E51882|nr:NAD-dependent deacylase [uncultured Xanthomonas sp.]
MLSSAYNAETVAAFLHGARRLLVLTGAGMSAESGVPTFRGQDDSLWSRFDPEQLATEDAWRADPALVWGWYRWRMAIVAQAQPHAGHLALARLAEVRHTTLVTQNVDDLHQRAGSEVAAHVHGRLSALRCSDCGQPWRGLLPPIDVHTPSQRLVPPVCAACGGTVRPGVVWFGEALPAAEWARAQSAAAAADLVLVIGSSGLVYPAASLPLQAKERGACVVEINPEPSALSARADLHWRDSAAVALPLLLQQCMVA